MDLSACRRLLVVKPSSFGDVVHALPAVSALHRAAPGAGIDWIVNPEWAPLLEGLSWLREAIPFPRHRFRGPLGLLRGRAWAREALANRDYDLVVDFQGLLRSALLGRIALGRSRGGERARGSLAGFAAAREGARFLYDRAVELPCPERTHAVARNLALATALGAGDGEVRFELPGGRPVKDAGLVHAGGAYLLLHPFSRGEGKSLSVAETAELCELLRPHRVVLVGQPPEENPGPWPGNVADLLGKTDLLQLVALLRGARWTVSVDSGPMHLAAALGDRVLSLHTWTNPAVVGPWPPEAAVFREGRIRRVRELDPAEFPERRDLRKDWGRRERLLSPADLSLVAGFVHERLGEPEPSPTGASPPLPSP